MQLITTEVQATYRVVKPFRLPFHCGSMLRGVLGRALRAAGCGQIDAVCKADCEAPRRCSYARLFDPPVPDPVPHRFLRGQTRAPQPMIPVFPPPGQVALQQGDPFSLGLRVIGPLRQGELHVLLEMLEGASRFDFGDEQGRLSFKQATLVGQTETPIATDASQEQVERIDIAFVTPAWIEHQGQVMQEIAFQPFFRSMYRRLTVLCALYGEGAETADADFARLDALAKTIIVTNQHLKLLDAWQRRSLARDREHPMQGFVGSVTLEGRELGAFLPMLRLAEKTHVGKATSFGLGRIQIALSRGA